MAARRKSAAGSLVELVTIVAVALGLALGIQAFLVKPFRIPSESMVPTLEVGQRVLVDRVSFRFSDPDRGDIVVFKPPRAPMTTPAARSPGADSPCPAPTPERSDTNFIKRVVAVGGDRSQGDQRRVYINGKRQRSPSPGWQRGVRDLRPAQEITIPKGHYFMMGDNRGRARTAASGARCPRTG